jgi:hydrogenase-4 component F
MAGILLLLIVLAPSVAIVAILLIRRPRVAEMLNLAAGAIVLAASLALPWASLGGPHVYLDSYIATDPFAAWVILCAAIVYFLASVYGIGYMRMLDEDARLPQYYALFAAFALTTLLGPMMNSAGLYWIAIELTTLVSTFLVAFEHAPESIEAAWKYIIVVSGGISLALLGTVLFYWAGTFVLGPSYNMTWDALRAAAPHMNRALLLLAFLLVLIGYGTKVGLAPMHTWLPDAHSEGPAPVSALLSGALLNTAMVGVVRYLSIIEATAPGAVPRAVLVALGIFSLFIAAMFIVRQRGIKRLMAYSSVEHMGIMALGFGFGGPLGIAGALYHMLNHTLNKSLMFFGAGSMMRSYQTKDIGAIRHVGRHFPVVGALWLAGAVAITGAPPFGLFASEFTILRAGLAGPHIWAAIAMALLLIVVFIGFLNHFRAMYYAGGDTGLAPHPVSLWCSVPMWLALTPLLVLGLWWPDAVWRYFSVIADGLRIGATQVAMAAPGSVLPHPAALR